MRVEIRAEISEVILNGCYLCLVIVRKLYSVLFPSGLFGRSFGWWPLCWLWLRALKGCCLWESGWKAGINLESKS